jgi:hypothetical protein
MARESLARSRVTEGNREPMPQTSLYGETFVEHPGFRPPEPNRNVGQQSHLPPGSGEPTLYRTTHQDGYPKMKGAPPPPVAEAEVRTTNFALGTDAIPFQRSSYSDAFKKMEGERIEIDSDAVRAFHTQHHSKVGSYGTAPAIISTSKSAFVNHGPLRPRSPAQFMQIEHVITPGDASHTVRQSSMRSDFVLHKDVAPPKPVNNSLQQSHLQFSSGAPPEWKTTQQDYFQWQRFRFD